jgi:proton-coupled amino acid transporter
MIAALFICTTVITIFGASLLKITSEGPNRNYNNLDMHMAGKFFGVVCFSIEGIGLMLPIRATLKKPSMFRFLFNSVCGMIISFYFLYGVTAAYAYGPDLKSVILLNFGHSSPVIYVQSMLYSVGIFISFPYVLFPLAPSIATSITGKLDNSEVSQKKSN